LESRNLHTEDKKSESIQRKKAGFYSELEKSLPLTVLVSGLLIVMGFLLYFFWNGVVHDYYCPTAGVDCQLDGVGLFGILLICAAPIFIAYRVHEAYRRTRR
jgi:hypothetical protein